MAEPLPDWVFPPPGGFTAEDLDRIPGLPPHTELLYGSLVFVSPQSVFHSRVIDLLMTSLRKLTPPDYRVLREMTVRLAATHRPEPDIMLVHGASLTDEEQTTFHPADVVLTIEVVSVESQGRDRELKPQLYAAAGIPHFWRIEKVNRQPTVYVYELDPASRTYAPTGIHHGFLKLTVPFDIEIDLSEYNNL
jgi:Uma2 family endonuclease